MTSLNADDSIRDPSEKPMHHSRLSTFVIDCNAADLTDAATFWGGALGRAVSPPEQGSDRYRDLSARAEEPLLMIQRVDHPSCIHLDIEADDIEAEVQRLEKLGAKRVQQVKTWWVLEAPTGQRFCVVKPQREPLTDANSNRWD